MTSGLTHVSRVEKKTCGCANTLVDLCNSRAGGLWSLLGASKMAGLVWKSHGMKTVTMQAPVDFPLAVSYHFVHHLANRRRARKHGSISSCASFPAAAATRQRWSDGANWRRRGRGRRKDLQAGRKDARVRQSGVTSVAGRACMRRTHGICELDAAHDSSRLAVYRQRH